MKQPSRLVLCIVIGILTVGLFPLSAVAEPSSAPSSNPTAAAPQAPSIDPTSSPTIPGPEASDEVSQDPTSESPSSPSITPPPDESETSPEPTKTPSEPSEDPSQDPSDSSAATPTVIGADATASGVTLTHLAIETTTDPDTNVITHALTDTTDPFSLFALSWSSLPTDAQARVRTLSDSGWTDWIEIHVALGESLVGTDSRESSEAMWVGISHGFELEIIGTGEASDIQVTLVHSTEKPILLKANTRANAAAQSPYVYVQQPSMVSRASWGAMEQDDCGPELFDQTVLAAAIHHTAGTNNYSAADVYGILRSIQAYHEVTLKWCDIGYNFLVDRFGTIYEGRGGGVSIPIHGAHSGEWNSNTTGISLIMNTETYDPSPAVLDSVAKVTAWKLANNYRNPLGKVTIANKTIDVIFGHGDVQSTACPGKFMKAKMATLRTQVAALVNAATPSPIKAKWEALGVAKLGQPYQLETSMGQGRYTVFTSGYRIYWSASTGAVPVEGRGAIGRYYTNNSEAVGALGFPLEAETEFPAGSAYQTFENGAILSSSLYGAHRLTRSIWDQYRNSANLRATLGRVTSDPYLANGVVTQDFEGGRLTETMTPLPTLTYQTHVENVGWQTTVGNGAIAGTTGKALRVEAIRINLVDTTYTGDIVYQTHIQGIGWQDGRKNGSTSGTTGQGLRIEGIRIDLSGQLADHYDIYYRAHVQSIGWMAWAKNGDKAGTEGRALRLEAIEIQLVLKGLLPSGSANPPGQDSPPKVSYRVHGQNYGWQGVKENGAVAGTIGRALHIEAITLSVLSTGYQGNIHYTSHVQDIGWQTVVSNGATSGTTGRALRLEALQITLDGDLANHYDVYYRGHVQDAGWLGWIKNGGAIGSTGAGKRLEAVEIRIVPKGSSSAPVISGKSSLTAADFS